jgi:hypothetical protein
VVVIDWRCSSCGGSPKLTHRLDHDGWHSFDHAVVRGDVVMRAELVRLCSLACLVDWLSNQELAVRGVLATDPDVAGRVDEVEEGPDALPEQVNGHQTDSTV